ncbi:hypothetical protein DPMN_091675 [Dreissena polymorpha]|uniref:Secreted protein n=1 Tax=Dreissena polymorpha TaxID=45954 RepID=A0A9D4L0Y6_DREPO|nr:hypothetical protein DPMN_091675 [Dreissena polymorpha]
MTNMRRAVLLLVLKTLNRTMASRPSCSTMTLRSNSSSGSGSTNFCGGRGPPITRIQRRRRNFGPGRQES